MSLDGITRLQRPEKFNPKNPTRHSPVLIQNQIHLQIVGPDESGQIVTKEDKQITGNILTTWGLNHLCELIATGGNASNWIGGMRIGTDNTVISSTDNQLGASTGSIDLTDASDVIDQGNRTLRCVGEFSSNNPAGTASIREIGIFASSNDATTMIAGRELVGGNSAAKGASDSINVTYDFVFNTGS